MIAKEAIATQRGKVRKLVKRLITDNVFDRIQKALERAGEELKRIEKPIPRRPQE
jgi:hypothetical protein